jgi:hypothetical protein
MKTPTPDKDAREALLAVMNVKVPSLYGHQTVGELFGSEIVRDIVKAALSTRTPPPSVEHGEVVELIEGLVNRERLSAPSYKFPGTKGYVFKEGFIPLVIAFLSALPTPSIKSDNSDELTIADYEEVLADKRRLTRELDIAMHGEDGAAKQASLCDLIPLAKNMRAELVNALARVKEKDLIIDDLSAQLVRYAARIAELEARPVMASEPHPASLIFPDQVSAGGIVWKWKPDERRFVHHGVIAKTGG